MDKHQRFMLDTNAAIRGARRNAVRGLSMAQVERAMSVPAGVRTAGELPAGFGAQGAVGGRIQAPRMGQPQPPPQPDPIPPFAGFPGETVVDIYVSVGVHGEAGNPSCDHADKTNCELWWIQMELPGKSLLAVQQLQSVVPTADCPGGRYHLQPAASPGGTNYAWHRGCLNGNGQLTGIDILQADAPSSFGPPVEHTVRAGTPGDMPMYPNWYDSTTITYDTTSAPQVSTLWSMSDWATAPVGSTGVGPQSTAGTHLDTGYEDAATHPAPTYPGATGEPRVVSFGGAIGSTAYNTERIPRVTDIAGDGEEVFALPAEWRPTSSLPPECHHPAWNPFGNRILCTRYQDAESIAGATAAGEPINYAVRRLYRFEADAGPPATWVPSGADAAGVPGAMVEALTDDEFNRIAMDDLGVTLDLFPPRSDLSAVATGCLAYVWKFAEWCASEQFVVATVYCMDGVEHETAVALHSRVVLIDTTDTSTADAYTDLTAIVEDELGVPRGTYSGIFVSCGWAETLFEARSAFMSGVKA